MKAGMSVFFQSPGFLEERGEGATGTADHEVYRRDRELADMAEPLGFDSIWSVEHHFDGYTMCPDVTQFLAYMAGRTTKIQIGSMVVVLPWHNPVRVAESVSMLDNLSDGRFIFGIGRGLGRIEFDGLGIPMDESRERFVEGAEIILEGLENGYVKYEGKHFRQEKRWLRPAPLRSFRGRTYAAAVSPESMTIMANLGVGLLIIPQKPWETVMEELEEYKTIYRDVNGTDAPPTIVAGQVFCDEDKGRARDLGRRYIGEYYATVLKHYELAGEHFGDTKGYEYYEKMSKMLEQNGEESAQSFYADLQVYGTPDQCVEKISAIKERVNCDHFISIFSYASMPWDDVLSSVQVFNDKVRPRLKTM